MIGDNSDWDAFITAHRWAVLTTLRTSGSPVSSVVAYAREQDSLVVSTPGDRFKVASLRRNAQANLCVLSNAEPFNYVSIEGPVQIEEDDVIAATAAVFDAIADTGYQRPEDLAGWIAAEGRVILRLQPQRVFGVIR